MSGPVSLSLSRPTTPTQNPHLTSQQKIPPRLPQQRIILRHKLHVHRGRGPAALLRVLDLRLPDVLLRDAVGGGRLDEQLVLAGALERDEPAHGFADGAAAGEDPVVLEDDVLFGGAEGCSDVLAFLLGEDDAAEAFVDGEVVEEAAVVWMGGVNARFLRCWRSEVGAGEEALRFVR